MTVADQDTGGQVLPFEPYSLTQLINLELPQPEWVVRDLLPLGSSVLLSGREKSGKGYLMIDLLLSVALGEPFLGHQVKQGPVVYCAAEEDLRTIRGRVEDRIVGVADAPFYTLDLDGRREGYTLDLASDDPTSLARLVAMVAIIKPLVIVLDPLRELHSGHENDSDDMGPILKPIRDLARDQNTSPIAVHHMNRNGTFRGSTAILSSVDVDWSYTDKATADAETNEGILAVKGRDVVRRAIPIRQGEHGRWEITDAPVIEPERLGDRILDRLAALDGGAVVEEISRDLDVQPQVVQNTITRMLRAGSVSRTGGGRRGDPFAYFLTETRQRRF